MTTAQASMPTATRPVVEALVESARRKGRRPGAIGVRARPVWDGPTEFPSGKDRVVVVPCLSALAVREALVDRVDGAWLVILTDRDERDLGIGIMAHLADEKLRTPNPWEAVRDKFGATRIDYRLVKAADTRELAAGLLAAGVDLDWPPAPGGLVTYDHAMAWVASTALGLGGSDGAPGPDEDAVEVTAVLRWTTEPGVAVKLATLRSVATDPLADAVLGWLASRCGRAGRIVGRLLSGGRMEDAVPLGLAARVVLDTPFTSGPWALLRNQLDLAPTEPDVVAFVSAAEAVARDLLVDEPAAARVLAQADALVVKLEGGGNAESSDLLRGGLGARLELLGTALHRATRDAPGKISARGVAPAIVDQAPLRDVEAAWQRVEAHALARHHPDDRVARARHAVRLTRWLATDQPPFPRGLTAAVARYRDQDAWVDRAYADVWNGVGDEVLADGLRSVLGAVRQRRDAQDLVFADALAAGGALGGGAIYVEDLMARVVLPLARRHPALLVVADGMSEAVGTEIVDDIAGPYDPWHACVPDGSERRYAAVAALPSVTEVSRASLLCGALKVGQQSVEKDGFAALLQANGLTGSLFHKLPLDSSAAGHAVAPEVGSAVDDVAGMPLVACVLNTIDDALDRSDPGGTDWTADAVKHLVALLERARRAGRVVVLTSDHGHVVDRREGPQQPAAGSSSNRSRPGDGDAPGDGEVRVTGPRVLKHGGDAILAVDERIRYGPRKAGYHGGAAPSEVVIPVYVLTSGEPPDGWLLAPPQSPGWWRSTVAEAGPASTAGATASTRLPSAPDDVPTLFDEMPAADLVSQVLGSATYREQRSRAARVTLTDERVAALLQALVAAPSHRVDQETAAAALGVAVVHLGGAVPMVQRLLNVEQYPVLDRDSDGQTVVLDVALLREQFGVVR